MSQHVARTPEEIADLKKSWKSDPCWDIEDTEGFEAHRDELRLYHEEQVREWERLDLLKLELEAKRQGITIDQAREVRTQERLAENRKENAARYFRNFMHNVNGLFDDFDAEAIAMIQDIVDAAVAEVKIQLIRGK